MSTRGYLGLKKNGKIVEGRFNHWDSYYDCLGIKVLELYSNGDGEEIIGLTEEGNDEDINFIHDGLYCEYGYIYNSDDDTLEIYRGFFKEPQFEGQEGCLTANKEETYFCHLIFIADRTKHTKELVLKAFQKYINFDEDETDKLTEVILEKTGNSDWIEYPEREIIPFKFEEKFKF